MKDSLTFREAYKKRNDPVHNKTRCHDCSIPLVWEDGGYRHVDEPFAGALGGHMPNPRYERNKVNG